jgi:hypothetical protein
MCDFTEEIQPRKLFLEEEKTPSSDAIFDRWGFPVAKMRKKNQILEELIDLSSPEWPELVEHWEYWILFSPTKVIWKVLSMIDDIEKIQEAVESGVPHEMRKQVWPILAKTWEHRKKYPSHYYKVYQHFQQDSNSLTDTLSSR